MALALLALWWAQAGTPFRDPSPHQTHRVEIAQGVQLEVLDWGGSGRPLVFLGGYLTAHSFDDIAPKLTTAARVVAITRRGLGASARTESGYTAQQSAADVLAVLDALKLEKPVLAGHSFGGQDLSVLAATHPQRLGAIVYLDSAEDISLGPVTGVESMRYGAPLPESMKAPKPDMSSVDAYRRQQRALNGMAFPEAEIRQLFEVKPDGSLGAYLVPKQVRDAMFQGLQAPDYSRIRVPVLAFFSLPEPLEAQMRRHAPGSAQEGAAMGFQYGMQLAWSARNRDALRRGVPNARIVEVPSAKTYVFLTNESEVASGIREFLTTLR